MQATNFQSSRAAYVVGSTQYDPEELLRFATEHVMATGAEPTPQNVAEAINLIYREDGFALAETRYRIDGNTGDVVFLVAEGVIADVRIEGFGPSTSSRIGAYVQGLFGRSPLRQADLERAIMLASDLAGVSLVSEVVPSGQTAQGSTLRIAGRETHQSGAIGIDVVPIRPGTAVRGFVVQELYGVANGGDLLRLVGQATLDRGDDWSVSGVAFYRAPVGGDGTYVEMLGGNTVARRDFANVTSDSKLTGWNAAFVVAHPVLRDAHNFGYLMAEYEFTDARSRFLGRRLNSTSHAIRLRGIYGSDFANGGILRAALSISAGARPTTSPGNLPDGAENFAHVRSEVGLALPIGRSKATSLRLEWRGQWASARLPEVERFTIGHAPFLRGYAPAEVEGDRGWSATAELNRSIDVKDKTLLNIVPLVFASIGHTDILQPRPFDQDDQTLASVGTGAEFHLSGQVKISSWVAVPLRDGPQSRAGNPAFHIGIVKGW
ncbi:MAG: ShlB/FhaC/HecB family hemolysin secretion/activation protein [Sphingopyxis sp.]|nr:ShlB/FhaC/HecB family hemolysin secretion/activation protein [Sphingopyxis sp.]